MAIIKKRQNRCAVIALIAIIISSSFSHVNAIAHVPHHKQDMHPVHSGSSNCVSNPCCMAIYVDPSSLMPYYAPSHLVSSLMPLVRNSVIDLPYKPPKN